MSLLSLAYVLLDRPMQRRFEADPRFQATAAAAAGARAEGRARIHPHTAELRRHRRSAGRAPRCRCACSRTPDTPAPEVQLLSNGRYHVMVTNAGGGYSRWKDLAVTRWREDAHARQLGHVLLPARRRRAATFWSAAHQPTLRARRAATRRSSPRRRAEFRRRDGDIETHTEIAVSPEDDIELRRAAHHQPRARARARSR